MLPWKRYIPQSLRSLIADGTLIALVALAAAKPYTIVFGQEPAPPKEQTEEPKLAPVKESDEKDPVKESDEKDPVKESDEKVPVKEPEEKAEKAPVKEGEKEPVKGEEKVPVKGEEKEPVKGEEKVPEKTEGKAPMKEEGDVPRKVEGKSPEGRRFLKKGDPEVSKDRVPGRGRTVPGKEMKEPTDGNRSGKEEPKGGGVELAKDTFVYDARSSTTCGKGKICFTFKLPKMKDSRGRIITATGKMALTLSQNGQPMVSLESPELNEKTGGRYCFPIDLDQIGDLDRTVVGLDVSSQLTLEWRDGQWSDGVAPQAKATVGSQEEGINRGLNNDYQFVCKDEPKVMPKEVEKVENTRVPKKETLLPIPEGQAKSRDCECHAQNAANNWIFGNRASINFGGNPPSSSVTSSLVSSAFNTAEGCSTISDASGNLLFYTDGTTVWDKNHSQMSNGTGLNGNSTSTQSALIVPCSCDQYFIFTTGNQYDYAVGLCYSTVDMTLNNNLGDVVTKNTLLLADSSEKVAAVSDGDGGYWVVAHTIGDNCFHSFHILSGTCTPQLPAVISAVGAIYDLGYSKFGQGQMKFSPDGKLLAHAGLNLENYPPAPSFVELFSFNKSTGSITNYLPGTVTTRDTKPNRFYGLEFSPNSQSLWATTTQTTSVIYHYPITSGIGLGTPTPINLPGGAVAALQLGPDNKIYVARIGQSSIYVLPTPDAANGGWISPNDTANLLPLAAGSSSQYGLPTVIAGDYCGSNPGGNTVACGCCPGKELVVNGDFEQGGDIGSEYHRAELGDLFPGTYNVGDLENIERACSNWKVPEGCKDAFYGNVLFVNGQTNQPADSTSVIWEQTIELEDNPYRICFHYLPLPQCCFNVQAKPFILVNGRPLRPTDICDEDTGCGHLYSATFTGGGTVNLQIVLPEGVSGDGNDLLIDNISMVKIVPVPSAVVDFDYSAAGTGGTKDVTLTANSPSLTSPAYTWWWEMWDTTDPNNPVLLQTVLGNPGNVTTVTFPGLMMKPKTYLFKLKAESDCESIAGSMQDWDFGPTPTARSAKGKSIVDPNPEPLNRKTIKAGNPEAAKREKGSLPTKRSE